jgi:tetratricopeptide (TPR) repeat protein
MKIVLISLLLFIACHSFAQPGLEFNKRFVESEDRWVAFALGKDSSQPYGFIYIDAQAGLTLQYEGNFTIGPDGKFISKKATENGSVKIRLEPNSVKVAFLPEYRVKELGHDWVPDWLSVYKQTSDTVGRMVRWGYYYNHWGESAKALTYLEKAYALAPQKENVEFELAYAYNALERFSDAIKILDKAIQRKPAECLYYKELSYAQIHVNNMSKADEATRNGVQHCEDNKMKAEICYNLTYTYFKNKDKANFINWAAETKKWAEPESVFTKNIGLMEKQLQ